MKKAITILISLNIIIVGYLATYLWAVNKQYFKAMPYTYAEFNFTYETYNISREQAKKIVDAEFSKPYTMEFKDLDKNTLGECYIMLHKVILDDKLSGWSMLETLTHELCHLNYKIGDEKYTEFLTFKTMWESKNPILNERAKRMAIHICTYAEHDGTEYDCSYYIVDYLRSKNVIQYET